MAQAHPHSLTVFLPIHGTVNGTPDATAAFADDPGLWLPEPARTVEPGRWVTRLHAGVTSQPVVCEVGSPTGHAGATWRRLCWQASDPAGRTRVVHRAFPRFEGEVGLVTAPAPTLVLSGTYDPPGGSLGIALDRAGLERVAEMTGRRLLTDISGRLRQAANHRAVASHCGYMTPDAEKAPRCG